MNLTWFNNLFVYLLIAYYCIDELTGVVSLCNVLSN
jgi:hypothetical protein